jgi:hypothetical protein
VLDGDILYVDRNANGDLTEAGERIVGKDNYGPVKKLSSDGIPEHLYFELGEITETDGKTKTQVDRVGRSERRRPLRHFALRQFSKAIRQIAKSGSARSAG